MKTGSRISLIVLGLLGVVWIGSSFVAEPGQSNDALYYRSPMHPWVTSDRPGECTVCGMALVPVYREQTNILKTGTLFGEGTSLARFTNAGVRELTKTILVSGRVVPNRSRTRSISAEVDGRIERVFVESTGVELRRNDHLFSIYSSVLREAERDYHLLFQQSQMNHSSRITAEHARLLKAMRLRLLQYGLTPKQIADLPNKQDNISTADILSPSDGIVSKLLVSDGGRVQAGQELMEINDLYYLWFEFDLYENDLPGVTTGQSIRVTIDDQTEHLGSISFINHLVKPKSRGLKARADLRNPVVRQNGVKRRSLVLGSYGEGLIEVKSEGRLALPRAAFLNAGERYVVFVQTESGLERREVKIGFRGDVYWEVTDGIQNTDKVLLEGNLLMESESRL